jgi:hypothetical protein
MEAQNIIVALIVLAALAYVGQMLWRKAKAFSPKKSSCESDCGCGGKNEK